MLSLTRGQSLYWSQNHAGGPANLHSAFPACFGGFPPGCVVLAGLSVLFAHCRDARGRDAPDLCFCTQRLLQEPRLLGERTFRKGFPLPCHFPLVLGKKRREPGPGRRDRFTQEPCSPRFPSTGSGWRAGGAQGGICGTAPLVPVRLASLGSSDATAQRAAPGSAFLPGEWAGATRRH